MGACFSKKTIPAPLNSDHHNTTNDPQLIKKEIFFIKHPLSREIHPEQENRKNPSPTTRAGARSRTYSHGNEDMNAILTQCDNRLSRSNSVGAQNPIRRRRCSRSKRSFDLGFNSNIDTNSNKLRVDDSDDDDNYDELNHRHRRRQLQRQNEVRVSSSTRSISKERRISISPSGRSSSKERRISISPSRRSESPFRSSNSNPTVSASRGGSNNPAKMVSVPATDKSNNAGGVQKVPVAAVKRIHVKRNVSPARRISLAEIDNNAARSAPLRDTRRTRKISCDLDASPERIIDCDPNVSPRSYASLLLEDINNFHKKKTSVATTAATTPPSFALPECVSKACLIMEAVADLNSSTTSLCSDERWRNPNTIRKDSSL